MTRTRQEKERNLERTPSYHELSRYKSAMLRLAVDRNIIFGLTT